MVRDCKIIRDEELIYKKKFLIWGAGKGGQELFAKLQTETDNIAFIDSDNTKSGYYCGKPVYGLEKLPDYLKDDNAAIIISVLSIELQKEILDQLFSFGGGILCDVYTKFAVELALSILQAKKIEKQNEEIQMLHARLQQQGSENGSLRFRLHFMEQLFTAEMSEKTVFVYSSKKVASSTICLSACKAGVYALHTHFFRDRETVISIDAIRMFIKRKHGKMITLVRDPIARQISLMWHILGDNAQHLIGRYGTFDNIEKMYLSVTKEEDEFAWFQNELEQVIGICVFDYPFNRELGYSVIEKDGISLLILKMEKLASLEGVIAEFLQEDSFKFYNDNVTKNKKYAFAYQEYMEHAVIPDELIEHYYHDNDYMRHFYTEDEIQGFYKRWKYLR